MIGLLVKFGCWRLLMLLLLLFLLFLDLVLLVLHELCSVLLPSS